MITNASLYALVRGRWSEDFLHVHYYEKFRVIFRRFKVWRWTELLGGVLGDYLIVLYCGITSCLPASIWIYWQSD